MINFNSPARKVRINAFCDFLERHPCPFKGRNPTWHEERAWEARNAAWWAENSHEVDMESQCPTTMWYH